MAQSMKVDDVISLLSKIKEKYGNVQVVMQNDDEFKSIADAAVSDLVKIKTGTYMFVVCNESIDKAGFKTYTLDNGVSKDGFVNEKNIGEYKQKMEKVVCLGHI